MVVLGLAIAALLAPKVAPKIFDGRTKEAATSRETTADLLEATRKSAAAQTASATVIGEAAADLPPSANRSFIMNEVPIMLSRGPAPDPKQIIAARDRRIAFLEGKLEAQRELTGKALDHAGRMSAKIAEVVKDKQASDDALAESAAYSRGKDMAYSAIAFVALLLAVAFLWLRNNSLPFSKLGELKAMVVKGESTLDQALDAVVDSRHWAKVSAATNQHFTSKDFKK